MWIIDHSSLNNKLIKIFSKWLHKIQTTHYVFTGCELNDKKIENCHLKKKKYFQAYNALSPICSQNKENGISNLWFCFFFDE